MILKKSKLFKQCFDTVFLEYRLFSLPGTVNEKEKLKINEEKKQEFRREYYLKNKEKVREYNLKNREKNKEYSREHYLKNKERKQQFNRQYRLKNKEKLQEYTHEYYLKNKEKHQQFNREYRTSKKEKIKEYRINTRQKMQKYSQEYRVKNKEKLQEYRLKNKGKRKEYRIINKEKILEKYILKKKKKNENYIFKKKSYSWSNEISVRKFLDFAAKSLHIIDPSDWYRISNSQIIKCGGGGLFEKHHSIGEALKFAYPELTWDLSKFILRGKKSTQRWLLIQMRLLLPHETILEDYHHPHLFWDSNIPIQIDIFVPGINFGLEYQGEQHYKELNAYGSGRVLRDIVERDNEKIQLCKKHGITLVSIPYWWDRTSESLSATLSPYFPELFPNTNSLPIPPTAPPDLKLG